MDTSILSHAEGIVDTLGQVGGVGTAKKRRRTIKERRDIVEETLVPGASVARVARRHDVNANQVFYWRKLYREGLLGIGTATPLLPVKIATERPAAPVAAEPIQTFQFQKMHLVHCPFCISQLISHNHEKTHQQRPQSLIFLSCIMEYLPAQMLPMLFLTKFAVGDPSIQLHEAKY